MNDLMEKIAALRPSSQITLLAETCEKLVMERDAVMSQLSKVAEDQELDELYHRLEATGTNTWGTRDETISELRKIAAAGKLEALKASLDLLPGSFPKVAAGLSSLTAVDDDQRRPNVKESRERFISAVMEGVDE